MSKEPNDLALKAIFSASPLVALVYCRVGNRPDVWLADALIDNRGIQPFFPPGRGAEVGCDRLCKRYVFSANLPQALPQKSHV